MIFGVILFMNASVSHVPQTNISSYGELKPHQTSCTLILAAPVGAGNITIGYYTLPQSNAPSVHGFENVTLSIQLEITTPHNQTITQTQTTTPTIIPVDFNTRGLYRIYITNNSNQTSPVPIGTQFEAGNPQNIEADKYLLSLILTTTGIILTTTSLGKAFILKRSHKQ